MSSVSNKQNRWLRVFLPLCVVFTLATSGCELYDPKCESSDPACQPMFSLLTSLALNPTRERGKYLYVTTSGASQLFVYQYQISGETTSGPLLTQIGTPVGSANAPTSLTLHPNRKFLYSIGPSSNLMYGYVIQSDGTLATMPGMPVTAVGSGPRGLVFSKDPNVGVMHYIGASNGSAAAISIGDAGTLGTEGAPFGLGCSPPHLIGDPTGKYFYSTSAIAPVAVYPMALDPATKTLSAAGSPLTVPFTPGRQAITPDGKFLYVGFQASSASNVVPLTRQSDGSVTLGTPVSMDGSVQITRDLAVHPTGRTLYTITNASKIYAHTIDTNSGGLTLVGTPLGTSNAPTALAVDPSGSFVYVVGDNATGGSVITIFQILADGSLQTRPDISPVTVSTATPIITTVAVVPTVVPGYDW